MGSRKRDITRAQLPSGESSFPKIKFKPPSSFPIGDCKIRDRVHLHHDIHGLQRDASLYRNESHLIALSSAKRRYSPTDTNRTRVTSHRLPIFQTGMLYVWCTVCFVLQNPCTGGVRAIRLGLNKSFGRRVRTLFPPIMFANTQVDVSRSFCHEINRNRAQSVYGPKGSTADCGASQRFFLEFSRHALSKEPGILSSCPRAAQLLFSS